MIEKVYLLHHPDFFERFEYITDRLKNEGIEYEVISDYSPSDIDYDSLVKNWESYNQIIIEQIGNMSYSNFSKKISPGSMSLVLKHIHCWKEQIRLGYKNILILEDDAEIPNGFSKTLESICFEFENMKDIDIAMIGTSFEMKSPAEYDGKILRYHPLQKTRCTHCYMISIDGSRKMIDGFKSINLPIDFKMNEVIQIKSIKVAWAEPGIEQKIFNKNEI